MTRLPLGTHEKEVGHVAACGVKIQKGRRLSRQLLDYRPGLQPPHTGVQVEALQPLPGPYMSVTDETDEPISAKCEWKPL